MASSSLEWDSDNGIMLGISLPISPCRWTAGSNEDGNNGDDGFAIKELELSSLFLIACLRRLEGPDTIDVHDVQTRETRKLSIHVL